MPLHAHRYTPQSPALSPSTGSSEGLKSWSSSCRPWAPAALNFGENQLLWREAFEGVEGRTLCPTFWMIQSTRRVEMFSTSATASRSFEASRSRDSSRWLASSRNSVRLSDATLLLCSASSLCEAECSCRTSSSLSSFRWISAWARSDRSSRFVSDLCWSSTIFWRSCCAFCFNSSSRATTSFRNSAMMASSSRRFCTIFSATSVPNFSKFAAAFAFTASSSFSK
mmetsp:Transcript_92564/g.262020  ORF Transcript_92564/g.262020 Transcript_92564/m.262020 type:complete len:225 (+) Transcript_92564:496-1170(+)